jgi:hypothetical protein
MIEFQYRENQLAVFLTEVHHSATHSLVECIGTNAGPCANCMRHHQIVPKVGCAFLAFWHVPVEKANDYSLPEFHEKWLDFKRAWWSWENAITFIDRQGGQIRSSGIEVDPHQ